MDLFGGPDRAGREDRQGDEEGARRIAFDPIDGYDPDDPEPDVLPGGGWVAHDLSVVRPPPRVRPTRTPDQALADAVATVLVVWRLGRGVRQRELARRLGVSQATLSRLERGRGTISFALLQRVAEITGSAVTMTIAPVRVGRAVRRLVLDGEHGGVAVHLVLDGPSARDESRPGPIS